VKVILDVGANDGRTFVEESRDVMLHKGQHTQQGMRKFLHENGFEVIEVWSQLNEDNLKFRRLNTC
jgi:hypothetical protein